MKPKEEAYLNAFRTLSAKKDEINAVIANLHAICDSLKDWHRTSTELGAMGYEIRPEWSPQRLNGITQLASLLPEYYKLASDVAKKWADLASDERLGLSPPSALQSVTLQA